MNTIEAFDISTPEKLQAEIRRLAKLAGGDVSFYCWSYCGRPALTVSSSYDTKDRGDIGKFESNDYVTFAEMFGAAESAIYAFVPRKDEKIIRAMALAIIDITDEHAECTVAELQRRGFTEATILDYHERACRRAEEMGIGPFQVRGLPDAT